MSWYNLSDDYQALFHIDYNSSTSFYTSDSNINSSLIYEKGVCYKTKKISKVNLLLKTPIKIPLESTWILVCKVYGERGSLAAGSNGTSNWGFEYTTANGWKDAGSSLSGIIGNPKQLSEIHYVVVTQDRANQLYKQYNNYGATYTFSSTFFSSGFGALSQLEVIGYQGSGWEPDIDILGYACFNKVLEETTIKEIIASIYNEAKIPLFSNIKPKVLKQYSKINKKFNFKTKKITSTIPYKTNYKKEKLNFNSRKSEDILYRSSMYLKLINIKDQVLEEGNPVMCKLFLYEKQTGKLLKTTFSSKNGEFIFYDLNPNLEYIITAKDDKYQFKSIIKDYNR